MVLLKKRDKEIEKSYDQKKKKETGERKARQRDEEDNVK